MKSLNVAAFRQWKLEKGLDKELFLQENTEVRLLLEKVIDRLTQTVSMDSPYAVSEPKSMALQELSRALTWLDIDSQRILNLELLTQGGKVLRIPKEEDLVLLED